MDMRLRAAFLSLLVLIGYEIEAEQPGSQPDGDMSVVQLLPVRQATLETRTFALEHLGMGDAAELVDPYVYRDRPGAPGTISFAKNIGAISVRETPDNLDRIARVLDQFDVPSTVPSYRLHFEVAAANDDETDGRLATVAGELRKVFRFNGYTLVGEGYVTASDGSFELTIQRETVGFYRVVGGIQGAELALDISDSTGGHIETRLGFRPGQTLVLGSMGGLGSNQTVFIVLHVAEA